MTHNCHALRCTAPLETGKLMCQKHWAMVPGILRDHVWEQYRPGQEIDEPPPSAAYVEAAWAAVDCVASQEGIPWHETDAPQGLR